VATKDAASGRTEKDGRMVQEQNMRVTTGETDGRTHLTSGDLPARTSENGEMCPAENEEVIRLRGRVVRGSGRASFLRLWDG
jgi:hypothetical protein